MSPVMFTRFLEEVRSQIYYVKRSMTSFQFMDDILKKKEWAIKRRKTNNEVGPDGVHGEMFQIASKIYAKATDGVLASHRKT